MSLSQYSLEFRKKKIIHTSLIITGLLLVCGLILFFRNNEKSQDTQAIRLSLVDSNIENEYYRDSDNDGAYDWEEELWDELDPLNPDSDGDGVLDGDYIKQKKRNEIALAQKAQGISSTLSESEQLGRSLYTALLAVNTNTVTSTDQTQEQISENIVDYVSDLPLGSKIYLREDLSVVQNSYENAQNYSQQMRNIFTQYETTAEDVRIAIEEIENPNTHTLKLDTLHTQYTRYLEALLNVSVPYVIAGRHTELVNSISQFSATLENLTKEEPDDLVSLSFVVQMENVVQEMDFAMADIEQFMVFASDPTLFN